MSSEPEDRPPSDEEPGGIAAAVEKAAGEQLDVRDFDRHAIYRDTADAASKDTLAFWLVLGLSAAIATIGLAQNNSAVVIGAMLVAPLLSPLMGLALSMAVGDIRLAVQTGLTILISLTMVVVVAWVLTVLLPFQTVTPEIAARTRPTTLDLAIAVFSGLAGAVVTVSRRSRLSAAIPGVALAVALIPPLAVAGFGLGIGFEWDMVSGSLLLFGANLAGIVLSGMGVFLLVGMHRHGIADVAREWHDQTDATGTARIAERLPLMQRAGVMGSARARIGLAVAFAAILWIPLSRTLQEIVREARVDDAVQRVGDQVFAIEGRSSVLNSQIVYGSDGAHVLLRVATSDWFDDEARVAFEERASELTGEEIRLTLQQFPAGADPQQLTGLLPGSREPTIDASVVLPDAVQATRRELIDLTTALTLPDSTFILESEFATAATGRNEVTLTYLAPDTLASQARSMVERQVEGTLGLSDVEVEFRPLPSRPREVTGPDDPLVEEAAALARRFLRLGVAVLAPDGGDEQADQVRTALVDAGAPEDRITLRTAEGPLRLQLMGPLEAEDGPR